MIGVFVLLVTISFVDPTSPYVASTQLFKLQEVEMDQEVKELLELINSGKSETAIQFVEDHPKVADEATESGVSLLLYAMYLGQSEVAAAIDEHRSGPLDVFEASALGKTYEVMELCESETALINAKSPDGFTPLHLAAFFDRVEVARYLLSHGAKCDVESENAQQVFPLHSAAASRSNRMVRVLLSAGADPDVQQPGGFTALHSAAKQGNIPMLKALLAHGADPDVKSDDGQTAIDFADSEKQTSAVEVIRGAQANH